MADDAYFAAARIHWEKFNHKREARQDLLKVIKFYKTGDQAGEAEKYLDLVEKGIIPRSAPVQMEVLPLDRSSGVTKAEERFIVVIDPGHGGSDSGAIGSKGTKEKNITLSLSKRLAQKISREIPNAKVYLTRTYDKTLTLDERVRFANTKNADFFISVHANASTSKKQHGIQTYFLNNASDEASARLAAQENKNSGKNLSDLDKILATMVQNASTEESREFGRVVHKSLVGGLSRNYKDVVDQRLRSALFYVLVGVKCPSILVETSYISNPKEEGLLKSEDYQDAITGSVAQGVEQYIKDRKSMAINL
jgi:N-acetylmuramoyl-L-alanine amidase